MGRSPGFTVVEYRMKQSRADPCVFRMVVGVQVELPMVVHAEGIVVAGSDETCRDFHAALDTNFPTSNWSTLVTFSNATGN